MAVEIMDLTLINRPAILLASALNLPYCVSSTFKILFFRFLCLVELMNNQSCKGVSLIPSLNKICNAA
jgi:hypothetical protein